MDPALEGGAFQCDHQRRNFLCFVHGLRSSYCNADIDGLPERIAVRVISLPGAFIDPVCKWCGKQDLNGCLCPGAARRPTGKQKVIKRTNPTAEAIDSMSSLFSEHDWKLTLPPEWVAQITGNKNNRRFAVPHDIKIKLATLSIALAQRTF